MRTNDSIHPAKRILIVEDCPTQAQPSIQKSEEDYRGLIDGNRDGMLVIDGQGALRYANSAARNFLGSECMAPQAPPLRLPVDIDGVLEMEIARENAPPATVEERTKYVAWEGMSARLVTLHDITAQKRAIERLERTRQEQLRVKDDFLSHVSHELRAPLSAIDEFVTILLDGLAGPISDEQREYLGIAHRNAGQLRDMIEDLLRATRTQNGKLSVEPCKLLMLPVLRDSVETLRPRATEKEVELKLEAAPELAAVYADPQRVQQILLNLLGNALKFTAAGDTITIAAARHPENEALMQISVRDTGCGISTEDCEHIFDQFYQVKSTCGDNHPGLGLGLFISRDLVARQGGRIWVESRLEQGSTFHFTLPLFAPDQVLLHALRGRLATAAREQGDLCVILFTLDADTIGRASPVADSGKRVELSDVWEELARRAERIAFSETAFAGNEFIIITAASNHAETVVQERLRRLLKDVLFQAIPAAVAAFSCGVAIRTAEAAEAAELLAAARGAQVHERERICAKYIVLVDDDSEVQRVHQKGLEAMGIRRIAQASGGWEALSLLEKEVPDLILIDMHMPGMNGYELIGRLKESVRTADIRILVVSGYEVKGEELREESPGKAIPVLAKPVEDATLTQYASYLL